LRLFCTLVDHSGAISLVWTTRDFYPWFEGFSTLKILVPLFVLLVIYCCCSLIIAPHRFLQVRGNYIRCILWYIVCCCFPHQYFEIIIIIFINHHDPLIINCITSELKLVICFIYVLTFQIGWDLYLSFAQKFWVEGQDGLTGVRIETSWTKSRIETGWVRSTTQIL